MGLFGDDAEDHTADKLGVYADMIKEREDELHKIDGIDTPNAKMRRKELIEEIRQTKINMADTKNAAERAGDDIGAYDRGRDMF